MSKNFQEDQYYYTLIRIKQNKEVRIHLGSDRHSQESYLLVRLGLY